MTLADQQEAVDSHRIGTDGTMRLIEECSQFLLDSVQDYEILMLDPEGRIATWNTGTKNLKGYSADEIIGRHFGCFFTPEDVLAHKPELELAAARETGRIEDEGWRIRKDGSRFWANVVTTPLRGPGGHMRGYAKVTQDVTERMRTVEQIKQLNLDLAVRLAETGAANRELESFCYSISHDLRAPLRAIDGFSRIILKGYETLPDPEILEYLEDIRANALQMGRLIDGLLSFSRLSRQALQKQLVHPVRLVQEIIRELRLPDGLGGREIRVGELTACQADPVLLKQVWTNLISNAVKYSGKQKAPVVEVGCQERDGEGFPTYFVRDNGVGFDMQYAAKLFGVFQRLHLAEDFDGTGVGLAIVQRIVRRHGGRIWADAQVNEGATFYFTLEGAGDEYE